MEDQPSHMADHDDDPVKLALVAHDLWTPLAAMRLTSELIASGPLNPAQAEQLSILVGSIDALAEMTQDLIREAMPEDEGDAVPTSLSGLVAECTGLFRIAAQVKGLTLTTAMAGNVANLEIASGLPIRRILMTLLDNAVKYTDTGSVSVEVDLHDAAASPVLGAEGLPLDKMVVCTPERPLAGSPGPCACIVISDTGPGISPDEQANLFRPFARGEHGRASTAGNGLGLWGAVQLLRLIGGQLTLSQPQKGGSRFELLLPAVAASVEIGRDRVDIAPQNGTLPGHVLIVDDNETNCKLLAALLESFGISSDTTLSGESALNSVAAEKHDAVLLDLNMPGMSGVETALAIRSRYSSQDLPMIAVTAALETVADGQLEEAGFQDALAKPISPAALYQALEKVRKP